MNLRFLIRISLAVITVIFLQACSTFRTGGAPEPAFDIDKDLTELLKHFGDTTSIKDFYGSPPSVDSRNRFVASRLVAINLRYMQFLRASTAERQALDSANDILVMSLGLAGASFTSATTKTVLAASSAAISGTKTTIDKNYYLEKTIPALIASMNAQRAETLIPILEGTKKSIDDYPFEQAVTDLHAYYFAGTYLGAIQIIQSDASVKEASAKDRIQFISDMPPASADLKTTMTRAIGSLKTTDLSKAKAVITAAGQSVPDGIDLKQAQQLMQALVRNARTQNEVDALAVHFKAQQLIQ